MIGLMIDGLRASERVEDLLIAVPKHINIDWCRVEEMLQVFRIRKVVLVVIRLGVVNQCLSVTYNSKLSNFTLYHLLCFIA